MGNLCIAAGDRILASSEEVAGTAGIPHHGAALDVTDQFRKTIENYANQGAARSFSGPIVRGDAATIKKAS